MQSRGWVVLLLGVVVVQALVLGWIVRMRRQMASTPPWPEPVAHRSENQVRLVVLTRDAAFPTVVQELEAIDRIIHRDFVRELRVVSEAPLDLERPGWTVTTTSEAEAAPLLAYWGDPVKWIERDGQVAWIMGPALTPQGRDYMDQSIERVLFGHLHICPSQTESLQPAVTGGNPLAPRGLPRSPVAKPKPARADRQGSSEVR